MTDEKVIATVSTPAIDRDTNSRSRMSRMRFIAFVVVGVMIISAISISLPAVLKGNSNPDNNPATISWNSGTARTATYTINHFFENYQKDPDYTRSHYNNGINTIPSSLGWTSNTPGWNDWQNTSTGGQRQTGYQEYTIRNYYPYMVVSDPNSATTTAYDPVTGYNNLDTRMAIQTWAPYRLTGVVSYEPLARTGGDATHINGYFPFVPHLGPNGLASNPGQPNDRYYVNTGGKIAIKWHGNYMTQAEYDILNQAGNKDPPLYLQHYAQWMFGVPQGAGWSTANDGYFYELYGNISYDHAASISYLGMPSATADARIWFNANIATIQTKWAHDWQGNGSDGAYTGGNGIGAYDIFTDYEYNLLNSGSFVGPFLTLDAGNSSTTTLSVKMYVGGWGVDTLINRLIEASNYTGYFTNAAPGVAKLRTGFVDYHEDLWLNVTSTRSNSNGSFRMTEMYQLMAWEDPSSAVWSGAWMLEFKHNDYMGNVPPGTGTETTYNSPFNKYDPDRRTPNYYRADFAPGSFRYDQNSSYWWAPQARNLSRYETIIFDFNVTKSFGAHMPLGWKGDVIGIIPWASGPFAKTAPKEAVNAATVTAMIAHSYWGTLKLGAGSAPLAMLQKGYRNSYSQNWTNPNAAAGYINISGGTGSQNMPAVYGGTFYTGDYWGVYSTGRIYKHGLPYLILDVSPIDHYDITVLGSHAQTQIDNVKVVARNSTGAYASGVDVSVQPFYNGTVTLQTRAGATATWGANGSSHAWTSNDGLAANGGHTGVWWTTITWTTTPLGLTNITARDGNFSLDVKGFSWFTVVPVPEFAQIVVPVLGMAAIFFVIRTTRKKKEE